MVHFLSKRILFMVFIVILASFTTFIIIQLPPGDYLTTYVNNLQNLGINLRQEEIDALYKMYGLGQPMIVQYFRWVRNLTQGNLGFSFIFQQPVKNIIQDRLPATLAITIGATLLTYLIAIPVGIYSGKKQYSIFDYIFTFIGFIGLAVPNFLLALILMWFFYKNFGLSIGGLFSPEYVQAGWSVHKVLDLLKHLTIPVIVIGTSGTASMMRVMRGSLLDEIRKPYVTAARTRGMKENQLLVKYPVRVALLPLISSLAWVFPNLISGATIVSVVLNLPTIGATLYQALVGQDMFLAGSCLFIMTILTVIGMFISDLLLAYVDPRIRLE